MEGLVKSLLDLSRIEATASHFNLTRVDFSQLVRDICEQFASRAEQTEHEFQISELEEQVFVMGHAEQLRQVVTNLLENALKFTPRKGSITVALGTDMNDAKLTITDTGIGIPVEDLPNLFERFHRARNVSNYAGNGLGLTIVKAIVTGHGGDIFVQSQGGNGTQVVVSIPVYRED